MPRLPVRIALALALCLLVAGCGDDAADEGRDTGSPDGEMVPANRYAEDFPSLATDADGDVWVAMRIWDGVRDEVVLRLLTDSEGTNVSVHASDTRVLATAMAVAAGDVLHVVWSEQAAGGWQLREATVEAGAERGTLGPVGAPATVASVEGGRALMPCLAADADGRLLLAWMQIDAEGLSIRGRLHRQDAGWGPEVAIAAPARSAWSPSVISTGPGQFTVAWDAAVDGDYDVLFARLAVEESGELAVRSRHRLTDTPRYEVHPSLATAGGRLYVAYEVGPERWGREGSTNKLEEALHDVRHVEIVCVEEETVAPLAAPFMDNVSEGVKDGCEQPRIQIDGNGNLVVLFQGLPLPDAIHEPTNEQFQQRVEERQGAGAGWRTSIWFTYMTRFDGEQWGLDGRRHPGLPGSNGRSDAPIALGRLLHGGTAFAVVGDGRARESAENEQGREMQVDQLSWWKPISAESTLVTVGRLQKGEPAGPLPLGPARPLPAWRASTSVEEDGPRLPTRTLADGRTVGLALGDLHRHTDLSRCSANWDGPFEDAMRYAYDAGGLQFVAVTDHFEHMTVYDWWRSLGYMDAYDMPGRMVSMRAYERADAQTGHRNVISGSETIPIVAYRNQYVPERDTANARSPDKLWQYFAGEDIVTIPHTPAGMYAASNAVMDWLGFNPEYDRVVEIFQGYRGSSEVADGPLAIDSSFPQFFVRPALDGGLHFGFIASSDHQSSYGAFAGAWVTDLSRTGVQEALLARRTFAATAKMALWAEWQGHPMGSAVRAEPRSEGRLVLEAEAFDRELALLELIVDGELVETRTVAGSSVEAVFAGAVLGVPDGTSRYAYVRVRTADGELGWTSPVRLGDTDPDGPLGANAFDATTGPALELGFKSSAKWQGSAGERDGR